MNDDAPPRKITPSREALAVLNRAAAGYVLQTLTTDELGDVGIAALELGCDTPSIRHLAALAPVDPPADRRETFLAALSSVGVPLPSRPEAARVWIRHVATDVRRGRMTPGAAASAVVAAHFAASAEVPDRHFVGDGLGVSDVIGAFWELAELAEQDPHRATVEQKLLAALARLADSDTHAPA